MSFLNYGMSLVQTQSIVPDDVLLIKSKMSKWVVNPGLGFRSGSTREDLSVAKGTKKEAEKTNYVPWNGHALLIMFR